MTTSSRLLDRDQFNELVSAARGNSSVFARLKYLDHSALRDDDQSQFVITDSKRTIIAAASVMHDPRDATRLWVMGVSVDVGHRRQGHATTLLRDIFAHAAARNLTVEISSLSDDGQSYLAPLIPKLHAQLPDLKVCTSRDPATVFTGHRPYRLGGTGRYEPK